MLAAPVADRAHGKVPEDDPNATERRFPGNQTRSYRTTEPLRVMEEITGW
ncbi:MAG: NAD(+)--rifampin ADP-ribosyltransferase [Humibacillus sp.]|nr:NAD(+)--rifampin ADP-ribosyltransferase [Humibacillus sp.]MDN5778644.1 NAD(+)--rifampin ADP-ribosyltransferase [Humibacillus sp.]